MRRRVTFFLGSPILLPNKGPATPDSWLAWAQAACLREDSRAVLPEGSDWIETIDLPLTHDAQSGVWAVSSLEFPAPGIWVPNTGYRNGPETGALHGQAASFPEDVIVRNRPKGSLFSPKEAISGQYRAMIYDLSGWFTPRIEWIVDFTPEQETVLHRLLSILAAVGVGRKAADGYGAVRSWRWVDTTDDPVWGPDHTLRRPVPAACVPASYQAERYVYALQSTRWLDPPAICAGPPASTWHPKPWVRPERTTADVRLSH